MVARTRSFAAALVLLAGLSVTGCAGTVASPSFSAAAPAVAAASFEGVSAAQLVARIREGDTSAEALVALRARGPQGLEAALAGYASAKAEGADQATLARLASAADAAGRQRDEINTGLYWYTDLEEAKRAAQARHLPILSLRMLGQLDDELSCANSRFFRTTLYPQEVVRSRLHDQWILHWSSERPVPVVTIDYGDGRVVRRTITGNSIHYVLDASGAVIDAIPGLYSADAFANALDAGRLIAEVDGPHSEKVQAFQTAALDADEQTFRSLSLAIGFRVPMPVVGVSPQLVGFPAPAVSAIPSAPAKAAVEMPVVRQILPAMAMPEPGALDAVDWPSIAAKLRTGVTIDAPTRAIMRAKAPLDWSTGAPRPIDDAGFERLVEAYVDHVALDMARNVYAYHPAIRRWLRDDPTISLGDLNARVYSELFLTPANDPWLGLVPPVAYSGIQGDGFAPAR